MKKIITLSIFCFFSVFFYGQENLVSRARSLMDNGKYSASQSLLNQALNQGYVSAELMYLEARCSKELFLDDAVYLYDKLNYYFPFHPFQDEVNEDLALLYYRQKKYGKAITLFEKVKNISSDNLFKLAYANFSVDSLEDAQLYFSRIIDAESRFSAAAKYYYAYISYKKGLYKLALKNFEELLNDKSFGSIVPYYISQIHFYQRDYYSLIQFAEPLSDNVVASRKYEIDRLLAEAYYRTDDFSQAINYLEEIINSDNQHDPMLYFMLGDSYYKTEDYEYAISNLENVLGATDSIEQYASYYLGASYLKLEYYNYALQAFKKSSSFEYNKELQENAYYNYAKLSYQLELPFDNTLEVLTNYLKLFKNPYNTKHIKKLLVKVLQATSRYLDAYDVLQAVSSPSYEQQQSLQRLAFCLGVKEFNQQNFKEAISYFDHSCQYKIDATYLYCSEFWLADCYFQLGDYDKAIHLYNNLPLVKELDDLNNLKKYNLAYAYFKRSDYINAIKWFRLYVSNSSDSMRLNDSYIRLGDSYFMNREFIFSAKYYNKAVSLNLFDIDYCLYQYSVSLALINKTALQLQALQKIIANYPNSNYYDNAIYDMATHYKNRSDYSGN